LATASHQQQLAASVSLISTFGQLAAERIGRSYGGGVLKFELLEARSIPVLPAPAQPLEEFVLSIDEALRRDSRDEARGIADRAILEPLLGLHWQEAAKEMESELVARKTARRGHRV
jgi:hypothetical protein